MFKKTYKLILLISIITLIISMLIQYNIIITASSIIILWLVIHEMALFLNMTWFETESKKHGFYLEFIEVASKIPRSFVFIHKQCEISKYYDTAMKKYVRSMLITKSKLTK